MLSLGFQIKSCFHKASHPPRPNNRTHRSLANFLHVGPLRFSSPCLPTKTQSSLAPPPSPATAGSHAPWRQRWRSAISASPTRGSTESRRPERRRSSRTSASPSNPASAASSSAPMAQVTPWPLCNPPSPPRHFIPFLSSRLRDLILVSAGARQDDDSEDTRREAHGGSEHGAGLWQAGLPRHSSHLLRRPLLPRRRGELTI